MVLFLNKLNYQEVIEKALENVIIPKAQEQASSSTTKLNTELAKVQASLSSTTTQLASLTVQIPPLILKSPAQQPKAQVPPSSVSTSTAEVAKKDEDSTSTIASTLI